MTVRLKNQQDGRDAGRVGTGDTSSGLSCWFLLGVGAYVLIHGLVALGLAVIS